MNRQVDRWEIVETMELHALAGDTGSTWLQVGEEEDGGEGSAHWTGPNLREIHAETGVVVREVSFSSLAS